MLFFSFKRSLNFSQRAPQSLLILRFSALGDLLLITPTIEALARRWPITQIFVASKESLSPILEHNPHITEIIALEAGESLLHFAGRLAKLKPQVILDLHNKARSKILRLLFFRTPAVVWKHRSLRHRLPLPLALKSYRLQVPNVKRYHQAAEKLVAGALEDGLLRYFCTTREREEACTIMKDAGLDLDKTIMGLAMGASWQTKAWPLPYFIELIAQARQDKLQIVLIGNLADKELAQKVQTELGGPAGVIDLCGLPLRLSAAVMSHCRAFVANDSGPMHIARALGIPTLAIFGPTDPELFNFKGHIVAYSGQKCSPCSFFGRRSCPYKHFRCMQELRPPQLWESLKILLKKERVPYISA